MRQQSQEVQRALARHLTTCAAHVGDCQAFLQPLLSQPSAELAQLAQDSAPLAQGRAEAVLRVAALLELLRGFLQVPAGVHLGFRTGM